MKLKDVYYLIDGVCLISIKHEIKYGNALLPEPTEELLNKSVKNIEPFYSRNGLYKYGVIIRLKDEEDKDE
jgi:hypothetical protein